MGKNKKNNKRLTFGLLIETVINGYHKKILSGIINFTKEKDINLLMFLTNGLKTLKKPCNENILFELIDQSDIDGLIITNTAIQNFIGAKKLIEFLKKYDSVPIACIGKIIKNYPGFIIDNEKSMLMLLTHLLKIHSYKKIAFITGSSKNLESKLRFNAYKKFLELHKIPFNPDLVVNGNLDGISGRNAVKILLKERKVDFDVIVAANDEMALGAIEELAYLGIQVPGGAFVVGFDNIEISKNVALTTVKQPLYELGYQAAQSVFNWLHNEKYELINKLQTELVIRETCGCYSSNVLLSPIWNIPIIEQSIDKPFTINKKEIINKMGNSIINISPESDKYIKKWSENLFEAFMNSYEKLKPKIFLTLWNKIIIEAISINLNLSYLQKMVTTLRKNTLYGNNDNKQRIFFEDIFHQAEIMIEEAGQKSEALQKIILAIQNERLSEIEKKLTDAGTLNELTNVIYKEFPKLEINSCFLSSSENPKQPIHLSKLILAYKDGKKISLNKNKDAFPTKKLFQGVNNSKNRKYNYIIQPLIYREEYLGFILMELGDTVQFVNLYEVLGNKISTSLRFIILLEKTILQAQNLELFNNRLKQSNLLLREFAYVASHDLQEPLRKINIFGNKLKKNFYTSLNSDGRSHLGRMLNAVTRMQTLIHDLLTYSKVTTMKSLFTDVDLSKIIKMTLSDLEPQIIKTSANIKVNRLPTIESNPTQMRQLFQNLISNAIKFHKPNEPPQIKIYSLKNAPKGYYVIIVKDNGIGIKKENYDRIFGLFQRIYSSDEYKGSGIGLAICKNIIENHEGSIFVKSKSGQGTQFIISLPIKQKNKS